MANPFLVLGGVAVGIVVATFATLQVPGWVKSAQDASAINDLGHVVATQAASASQGHKYLTGSQISGMADQLGLNFDLSAGVQLCVTTSADQSEYAAVALSPSGAFFARTPTSTNAKEGATSADALAAVGGLPEGVPDPVIGGKCAPGAGVGPGDGAVGTDPDTPLPEEPQLYAAMFTLNCTEDTTVTLPLREATGTATWSDGETVPVTDVWSFPTKDLKAGVEYTVTFDGTFTTLKAWGGAGDQCFRSMDSWSDSSMTANASSAFAGMRNLTGVPSNLPPTVTKTGGMFEYASAFNDADVARWDVSNVISADYMFSRATSFQQDISNWTFRAADSLSLYGLFDGTSYAGDLTGWTFENAGSVNLSGLFAGMTFNGTASGWSFKNAGDVAGNGIFEYSSGAPHLDGWTFANKGYVNVANFARNGSFDGTLNNWSFTNTGYVQAYNAFATSAFRGDARDWSFANTRYVVLDSTFRGSNVGDVSGWSFRNGDDVELYSTFENAASFKSNISDWELAPAGALYLDSMLNGAKSFTHNLSGWDVSKADGWYDFAPHLPANYLPNWPY